MVTPLSPRILSTVIIAVSSFCAALALPVLAEPINIPGTQVQLEAPAGFALSERFPGLHHPPSGSSILVTVLSAPYEEMVRGFTEDNLATRDMTLLSNQDVTISGYAAQLLAVTQTVNGVTFKKWMGVLGDAERSVLVMGTYPASFAERLSEPVRSSVLSATWMQNDNVGLFDGLSFSIEETDRLKVSERVQNMLMLTRPEARGTVPAAEPILIVGPAHSEVRIENLEGFAKERVKKTANITSLHDIEGTETTISGYPGYEITAKAADNGTGAPMAVYQLLVVVDASYYIAQGLIGADRVAEYLPQFRKIARSLQFP